MSSEFIFSNFGICDFVQVQLGDVFEDAQVYGPTTFLLTSLSPKQKHTEKDDDDQIDFDSTHSCTHLICTDKICNCTDSKLRW